MVILITLPIVEIPVRQTGYCKNWRDQDLLNVLISFTSNSRARWSYQQFKRQIELGENINNSRSTNAGFWKLVCNRSQLVVLMMSVPGLLLLWWVDCACMVLFLTWICCARVSLFQSIAPRTKWRDENSHNASLWEAESWLLSKTGSSEILVCYSQ